MYGAIGDLLLIRGGIAIRRDLPENGWNRIRVNKIFTGAARCTGTGGLPPLYSNVYIALKIMSPLRVSPHGLLS